MAEITVSDLAPFVNENNLIHVEFLNDETPVVSSLDVARHFQKKHKHVLDDIHRILSICPKSFHEPNFRPMFVDVKIGNGATRQAPAFLLTRDAFSLLVMGFTGKAAIQWKLKYIEAFNCLERAVRDNIRTDAVEYGRKLGLDEARALPAVQAERQAGYLKGMTEGKKLAEKRDGLRLLLKARGYLDKGLKKAEAAKLCGISRQYLNRLIGRSRKVGL